MARTVAPLTRAQALMALAGVVASTARSPVSAAVPVSRRAALAAAARRTGTLAASAARLGILFGTAADAAALDRDPSYAKAVARECSMVVPENALKAYATRATPNGFDFSRAERLITFAAQNGLAARGHALLWYYSVPSWVQTALVTRSQATAELLLEVTEPCKHFRGRLDSWDVVNEAVDPNAPDGLRECFWLNMIGPDYIPLAFLAARQADPHALLVLNEQGIEYDEPQQDRKRRSLLELLRRLRRQHIPIDALGIEAHLQGAPARSFSQPVYDRFLAEVEDLGLAIMITELDVNDATLAADVARRDSAVAAAITAFLQTTLQHGALVTMNVWGLSDRHTWLSGLCTVDGCLPLRPTLLDANLAKKPAYYAVRVAFDEAKRP